MATSDSELPLVLELDGERYCFATSREFEFALDGRTSLPPGKLQHLLGQPDDALRGEAEGIRAVEKTIGDAISGAIEDITSIGSFMQRLDPSLVSKDYNWRAIVAAVVALDAGFERYKKVALVKYLQYLDARQQLVRSVFAARHPARGAEVDDAGLLETRVVKDTLIFDLTNLAEDPDGGTDYVRLPKGETVEIGLEHDRVVDIMLARHHCALVLRDEPVFIDNRGHEGRLHPGSNVIGRGRDAEVVIEAGLRDVSRRHLVIERDGPDVVRLTDVSSHGTSVHPEYLDSTSI